MFHELPLRKHGLVALRLGHSGRLSILRPHGVESLPLLVLPRSAIVLIERDVMLAISSASGVN